MPDAHVIVLLSGGVDSAACLYTLAGTMSGVEAMFVDYGQPAGSAESRAAQAIADHYGVRLRRFVIDGARPKGQGVIGGRNAMLLSLAFAEYPQARLLAIGVHAGTSYYDCGHAFIEAMQAIIDGDTGGGCQISAPFLAWTKRAIWELAIENNVPVHLTHSCEGGPVPCGTCLSCRDREALRVGS
jgi:7-cyano-7-deazaguanine synthase